MNLLENSLDNIINTPLNQLEINQTRLSQRELEICNMIKNGLSSKDIASILNISVHTVNNHRVNIRKKMEINNNSQNLFAFLESN
jgi:DNA-binding CsgD family transcriptional regulator